MKDAAEKSTTLESFYALCATKKYPDARIRRGVLAALLRLREEELHAPITYTRLLAATATGCAFLSSVRRSATVAVVTRQTDVPASDEAQKQLATEQKSAFLYALCTPISGDAGAQLRRSPLIFANKAEKK